MKVILSRKGMDSESGVMASPILPDGTLLSLPIPDRKSKKRYEDIQYKGQNYRDIITQLYPEFDFESYPTCHLDPDIYEDIDNRPNDWIPAFGQWGVPATHLDKSFVDVGDLFLFYGMFRQTEIQNDRLTYTKVAPIRHIIYGYMEIGEVIKDDQKIAEKYNWHPHSIAPFYTNNRIYISKRCGTFNYDDSLVLTQSGQPNRSVWQLPSFFAEKGIAISWQGHTHPVIKSDSSVLKTASRGQEFVITTDTKEQEKNLSDWVKDIIRHK
ncbi:hypothetical protein EHV10_04345 [Lachnoanaerobaculum gingivalis]|uniref:Nucleotide modification associated domain-containing protein n=1 Tax=Lachnoanaerobaculum gingivalis TaxID=2490855 RepID=A0A3P3QX41_9FIRM|nr:hypothetical protein [Lachnoanaerobaculum gingivalis]RRJ25781.1 hypothetical protein EHV10_04345 [Lachnoanaerobaculum gingivalis]